MINVKTLDVFQLLRRRWWLIAIPTVVGVGAAWAVYSSTTPMYRATTTVMVEQQQVPTEYVRSTVSTSSRERLETIEQQIKSRAPLVLIVEELNLYPELRRRSMEKAVRQARQDLGVRVSRGGVFSISFQGSNPQTVADSANRVADLFIQENLRLREAQASNTSAFLDAEVADYKEEVEAQQEKIARFRIRHEGELPEQKVIIMRGLDQLETRLEINRETLHNAELRKLVMETRVANTPEEEIEVGLKPAVSARLATLRDDLLELKTQFTEKHPDVVRVQREIDALLEQARSETPIEREAPSLDALADAEPTPPLQIVRIDQEIERLKTERDEILEKIADYQRRLERIPRLEQEFKSLNSDFESLQKTYRSLQAKQMDAQLAEDLERSQQAEQFRLLDRALPPSEPYFPNMWVFLGLGLAGGLALGLGLALAREQVDQTFNKADELRHAFPGVQITASIPYMPEVAGRRRSRRGLLKRKTA